LLARQEEITQELLNLDEAFLAYGEYAQPDNPRTGVASEQVIEGGARLTFDRARCRSRRDMEPERPGVAHDGRPQSVASISANGKSMAAAGAAPISRLFGLIRQLLARSTGRPSRWVTCRGL
jgi:hypothetical protein